MKIVHRTIEPRPRTRNVLGLTAAAIAGFALVGNDAQAATASISASAPTIDSEDIAHLAAGTHGDKWWPENSGAGAVKGLTITTGPDDLLLNAITYLVAPTSNGEPIKVYTIRVGEVAGTAFTQIHTENATQDVAVGSWLSNEYMTWTFAAPVALDANTTYGIDVGIISSTTAWQSGIPYIQFDNSNSFADAEYYTSGTSGIGTAVISPNANRDRIFHLDLDVAVIDSDGDFLDDFWEDEHFGDNSGTVEPSDLTVTEGGLADADSDGATDFQEFEAGSDPHVTDTDSDNLTDGDEINTHLTDPTLADTDGDTLNDDVELAGTTDPLLADTDSDNLRDDEELIAGTDGFITDPTLADTDVDGVQDDIDLDPLDPANDNDGDGLGNQAETDTHGTDPLVADTDIDGLDDGVEVAGPTDPLDDDSDDDGVLDGADTEPNNPANDNDGDGLANDAETNTHGTDPLVADTDGDNLSDGEEVNTHGTDPLVKDSDVDGIDDDEELIAGTDGFITDPLDDDSDDDGVIDGLDTDPVDPANDNDGDGLANNAETDTHGTDPLVADTDGDGVSDGDELSAGNGFITDPLDSDSDDDGVSDGYEIANGTDPNDVGDVPPSIDHLNSLDLLGTGQTLFTGDGTAFASYVENVGGTGWLLVGRGREGWEFDTDGQGSLAALASSLGTSGAFAPVLLSDAIINDLITTSGFDLTEVEIRLKRAGDAAGTGPYQELRWRPQTQTTWRGNFDTSYNVEVEILSGPGSPQGPDNGNTRDYGGNDFRRVFTWAWGGHNNEKGFSMGSSVSGADNGTTFIWDHPNNGFNHAIPYTEVYIRLKNPVVPSTAPEITSFASMGGGVYELTLLGEADTVYEFRSSAILDFNPGALIENLTQGDPGDAGSIGGSNDSELTTDGNGDGMVQVTLAGPVNFVLAQVPPPLLSEDFESGAGGFTAVDHSGAVGSVWELGTPNSDGGQGGGAVTSGNGSSLNCWGTDITNPGTYVTGTDTSLISPIIDLTGGGATLSFAQAIDILGGDTLVINVLDDATDTVIETIHTSTPDANISLADWETISSIAITGGELVRIEWRFTGDGDGTYIGGYIDDVVITTP